MGLFDRFSVKMIEVSRITLFLGLFGILRAQMCRPAENTLGDCGCDGQIFVSSDCRQAYHCRDDMTSTDGCLAECGEGKIVIPDPRNGDNWYCVAQEQEDGEYLQCPGAWNTIVGVRDPRRSVLWLIASARVNLASTMTALRASFVRVTGRKMQKMSVVQFLER